MLALRTPRISRTIVFGAITSFMLALPAATALAALDPELEKQEAEVERLLKIAETEYWSLKTRIERDRNDRQARLAQAKADYEKSQASLNVSGGGAQAKADVVKSSRADRAREKYETELERALTGVDSARIALDRVEARVSQYRTALEALRKRTCNPRPQGAPSAPAMPDSSSSKTPITASTDPTTLVA